MVRALIIKTSAFGDIVHLFPAIQFMKDAAPDCTIDWVVEERCKSLVSAHPLIDQVICIDSKKWRNHLFSPATWQEMFHVLAELRQHAYDVVWDFQGNIKSGVIAKCVRSPLKIGFGRDTVAERPNLFFTTQHVDPPQGQNIRLDYAALVEAWCKKKMDVLKLTRLRLNPLEQFRFEEMVSKKGSTANVMVCPGSNWPNKQLLRDTLRSFLKRIDREFFCKFWFIYGTAEEEAACLDYLSCLKQGEVCAKMSLPLLQHWMGEMDHVIAMDSLPLHLAAEAGTPTFSIFGASSANKYRPMGPLHSAFQGLCPYGKQFKKRCPILRKCSTGACIHDLTADEIFQQYCVFANSKAVKH